MGFVVPGGTLSPASMKWVKLWFVRCGGVRETSEILCRGGFYGSALRFGLAGLCGDGESGFIMDCMDCMDWVD